MLEPQPPSEAPRRFEKEKYKSVGAEQSESALLYF
jgi:hypothetical protein